MLIDCIVVQLRLRCGWAGSQAKWRRKATGRHCKSVPEEAEAVDLRRSNLRAGKTSYETFNQNIHQFKHFMKISQYLKLVNN